MKKPKPAFNVNILSDLIYEAYKEPLPLTGSVFSTGANKGMSSSKRTAQGNAAGVLAKPLMWRTLKGLSYGTAGSATLFGPREIPEWVVIDTGRGMRHKKKAHLKEKEAFALLCGKEKRYTVWRSSVFRISLGVAAFPTPDMQCKICVAKYEKNVLEGRYQ